MTETRPNASRWRNPTFMLVFVPSSIAWLAVMTWLTWLLFHPVTDWIGRQHDLLQELCSLLVLLPWALLIGGGIATSAHLAERAAGIGPPAGHASTHGAHARWRRPEKSEG